MGFNVFDMICESIDCCNSEEKKRDLIGDYQNLLAQIERDLESEYN